MSTPTEQGPTPNVESPAEAATVPAPRTGRELTPLMWDGWPFTEWLWPVREAAASAAVSIRVEELVENGQVVVRAELPGVDPQKDIEVVVEDGVLTIRAQRHERSEDRTSRGYRSEFRYGSFTRQIRLPRGTTAEVVSATYRDGVLEVRMPAPAPGGSARRIDVERG